METRTDDLRVKGYTRLISPREMKEKIPVSAAAARTVVDGRSAIGRILNKEDRRLLLVAGPCSIHDERSALEYAERLHALQERVRTVIFMVMRVYFEKPRTTVGWKGLINDPDMNGTHQISKGLGIARDLLCRMTELKLPVATEMLDPITPEYMADMLCWGAIGARTTESQTHRELASGLSFPIGFKNGTDGNLQIAIDAMIAAQHPHSFLGINREGLTSIIQTTGNPDVHIVLRGGKKPNYYPEDIRKTEEMLEKAGLFPTIMVDCSHGNSEKNHEKQPSVMQDVIGQIEQGNRSISGVMIESYLEAGNQPMPKDNSQIRYGVSITDKCIDWATTERCLREAHARLKACGGRKVD